MSPDSTSASLATLLTRVDGPLDQLHHYQLAARIVGGRVIDLACGAGYGTAMLAQRAELVWGMDRSRDAVARARRQFGATNCRYLGGDPERLPFPGGSFDFVAWFGSAEADSDLDFETVLDEAHRVLAASGVLLISLPRSSDEQPAETALLGHRFAHVRLFGQVWDAVTGGWRLAGFRPGSGRRLEHLMAVCSHLDLAELFERSFGPLELADVADLGDVLLPDQARRESETRVIYEKVVEDLRSRLKAFDSRIRRLGREVEQTRGQQVADLLRRLEALEGRVVRTERERDALAQSLYAIHGSRMWNLWMVYHRLYRMVSPGAWFGRLRRLYAGLKRRRESAQHLAYRIKGIGIRALRAVHGLVRRAAFHGGLKVQRVLLVVPHLLGLPYLMLVGRSWRRRAELRRAAPEQPELAPRRAFAGPYGRRPRVLLVSPYPIYPPNHGGAVRIFNLIKRISAEVDLHLLILSRAADDSPQAEALAPYCASLHFHHWRPYRQPDLWGLRPPGVQLFRSREVAERLRELVAAERIDVLQLEYTELGQYADAVPGVRTILTEIDLTFRSRERRKAAGFHRRYAHDREFGWSRRDFMRLFRFEIDVCARADTKFSAGTRPAS
jgi:SAM-dependent methyltransferase